MIAFADASPTYDALATECTNKSTLEQITFLRSTCRQGSWVEPLVLVFCSLFSSPFTMSFYAASLCYDESSNPMTQHFYQMFAEARDAMVACTACVSTSASDPLPSVASASRAVRIMHLSLNLPELRGLRRRNVVGYWDAFANTIYS